MHEQSRLNDLYKRQKSVRFDDSVTRMCETDDSEDELFLPSGRMNNKTQEDKSDTEKKKTES